MVFGDCKERVNELENSTIKIIQFEEGGEKIEKK